MDDRESLHKSLNDETEILQSKCKEWQKILHEDQVPEEVSEKIRVAVGQSKLLLKEKFKEFEELLEKADSEANDCKPVTTTDLTGYWEVICLQVTDVKKKYVELQALKQSKWMLANEPPIKSNPYLDRKNPKFRGKPPSEKVTKEAKQRLAEVKSRFRKWVRNGGTVSDLEIYTKRDDDSRDPVVVVPRIKEE